MRYLLDVNMLVALGHRAHSHHAKALAWYAKASRGATALGTCAITELGFLRVSVSVGLQPDIGTAQSALAALKRSSRVRFELIADDLGAADLPSFVDSPRALTDGHLLELARRNSMALVTLDRGIPGAQVVG